MLDRSSKTKRSELEGDSKLLDVEEKVPWFVTHMVVNHDSSQSYANVINFCIDALLAFFVLSFLFFLVFGVLFDFFFFFWVPFFSLLVYLVQPSFGM